jgi:DNA-binding CsgD family transcriptional regulator
MKQGMSRHPTLLTAEAATQRLAHYENMLEDVPVGLLLLDAELRPQWYNLEAARACAVWNYGERQADALRVRNEFQLPEALAAACRDLLKGQSPQETPAQPQIVSDHTRGLHARIKLHAPGPAAAFHIQLDYRRPRGDRHRPLSPGAVALLARLTEREREVAMRVREGLRTAEIAVELHRSPLTIKTQLASIFSKIGVRGRTRVAALLNR